MSPDQDRQGAAPAESIAEAQSALVDEFSFFGDWQERYQYIIDLGRKLPAFPESELTEENRVRGCQSRVWIVGEREGERLRIRATSDSAIVAGLLAVLLRVYDARTPREILETPPEFIREIGFTEHLSPMRSNGFASALDRIRALAQGQLGD